MTPPSNPSSPTEYGGRRPRKSPPDHYDDDMDDKGDLDRYADDVASGYDDLEPLRQAIHIVQEKIQPTFMRFDTAATRYQWWYKWVSIGAVTCGAISVFFAVVEVMSLALPLGGNAVAWEVITVCFTLLFISVGIVMKLKEGWILSRYKAEVLRLLKFHKLVDPAMWCDPADLKKTASDLDEEVQEIAVRDYDDAKNWASKGIHPRISEPPCSDRCQTALHELVDYYVPKRLDVQIGYLEGKADSTEDWGRWTAIPVQFLFWCSFALVLSHTVVYT